MTFRTTEDGIARFNAEAQGTMTVHVILPEDFSGILAAVFEKDDLALRLMISANRAQTMIRQHRHLSPVTCFCCDAPVVDEEVAVVAILPVTNSPKTGIGAALCERCSDGSRTELMERAVSGLRRAMPGMEPLKVTHHQVGHG